MTETKPAALAIVSPGAQVAPKSETMPAPAKGSAPAMGLEPRDLGQLWRLCQHLVGTGFLPRAITAPAQAVAVVLAGKDLGLSAMQSLRGLNVVEGKVGLNADLMLGLMIRHGVRHQWIETTDRIATLRVQRPGFEPFQYSYTFEMAEKAGLTKPSARTGALSNYMKHPAAMLRARCVSAVTRAYAPDLGMGLYLPDEIDGRIPPTEGGDDFNPPARLVAKEGRSPYEQERFERAVAEEEADFEEMDRQKAAGPAVKHEIQAPKPDFAGASRAMSRTVAIGEALAENGISAERDARPIPDGMGPLVAEFAPGLVPPSESESGAHAEAPPSDDVDMGEADPISGLSPDDVVAAVQASQTKAEAIEAAKRGAPSWKGTNAGNAIREAYDAKVAHLASIEAAAPKAEPESKRPTLSKGNAAKLAGELDRRVTAAKSESEVIAMRKEIEASGLDTSTKEILFDGCNQRVELLRSENAAPPPTPSGPPEGRSEARQKEIDAMVARWRADVAESEKSGHPAKAIAAKGNARKSAIQGECSKADADSIGAEADRVIKAIEAKSKGGKAK